MMADEYIEQARSWVGTPFKHQGRGRNGIDCAGLLLATAEACGLSNMTESDYPHQPTGRRVLNELKKYATRTNDPKPGDLVLMAFNDLPTHLGILTDKETIIHAFAPARKVIEQRTESLINNIVGYFRVKWQADSLE